MQARPYRPDIGRFLTQDRFEAGSGDFALQSDPMTNNRYAFASANPVNNIEFDGHKTCTAMCRPGEFQQAPGGKPRRIPGEPDPTLSELQTESRRGVRANTRSARLAAGMGNLQLAAHYLAAAAEARQPVLDYKARSAELAAVIAEDTAPGGPGWQDYAKVAFDPTDPADWVATGLSWTGIGTGAKAGKSGYKAYKLQKWIARVNTAARAVAAAGTHATRSSLAAASNFRLTQRLRSPGQLHHVISTRIGRAIERHPNLAGQYSRRDPRFTTRAVNEDAHRGYQTWHRELDAEFENWLLRNPSATKEVFERQLRQRYSQPDLKWRFPNGF